VLQSGIAVKRAVNVEKGNQLHWVQSLRFTEKVKSMGRFLLAKNFGLFFKITIL